MSFEVAADPECKTLNANSVEHVISARPRDLGGFSVRRTLPAPVRRHVGPFVFFDHMGPATFQPGSGIDVRPHPHIGLATVTYLFDGEIVHRDSLGTLQPIRPGDVNWMTAGRGIAHSERTNEKLRSHGTSVHGIQCWVALPQSAEETEPTFRHHPASEIPSVERDGVHLRVIVGEAFGATSPVHTLVPTLYVEASSRKDSQLELPYAYDERAVYVVQGAIECDGERHSEGTMVVFRPKANVTVSLVGETRIMLLGGATPDGERHIWWNFVSSSLERIEQAKLDWKEGRFPKVPGDEVEFIPLPEK